MKWIRAIDLDRWAQTLASRIELSGLISALVRASAPRIDAIRFPTGDSAQIPGYDGSITAVGAPPYLPEGDSVWEFGTDSDYLKKANKDYESRSKKTKATLRRQATFVFVTPHIWNRPKATLKQWEEKKRALKKWKDVRAMDAVALEAWLDMHPPAAAKFARDILRLTPQVGARSTDEFWDEFASRYKPKLTEKVLLCGRAAQAKQLLAQLIAAPDIYRWQGDSPEEVLAFAVAAIREASPEERKFLEARTLILDGIDAARLLSRTPNLAFLARPITSELCGLLAQDHPVVFPLGREASNHQSSTVLARPTTYELGEALQSMGLGPDQARQLARECARSTVILAHRIPSASAVAPQWGSHADLVPALLAGGWDASSEQDREIVRQLANVPAYEEYEGRLRVYLQVPDSPLEHEGEVWKIRAPVVAFSYLAPLIGKAHLDLLEKGFKHVFAERDPNLDLAPEERPYAGLSSKRLKHSGWIRDGLATTVLLFAALGEAACLDVPQGNQAFVDRLVNGLPGLKTDWRLLASLEKQLPLLMEAAPRPLLQALGQLLEGDGSAIQPIFRDTDALFSSSPHTGLLWGLEVAAWDPEHLNSASMILAGLAHVDPGGKLANRPLNSLREIFLPWHPNTNAT